MIKNRGRQVCGSDWSIVHVAARRRRRAINLSSADASAGQESSKGMRPVVSPRWFRHAILGDTANLRCSSELANGDDHGRVQQPAFVEVRDEGSKRMVKNRTQTLAEP